MAALSWPSLDWALWMTPTHHQAPTLITYQVRHGLGESVCLCTGGGGWVSGYLCIGFGKITVNGRREDEGEETCNLPLWFRVWQYEIWRIPKKYQFCFTRKLCCCSSMQLNLFIYIHTVSKTFEKKNLSAFINVVCVYGVILMTWQLPHMTKHSRAFRAVKTTAGQGKHNDTHATTLLIHTHTISFLMSFWLNFSNQQEWLWVETLVTVYKENTHT